MNFRIIRWLDVLLAVSVGLNAFGLWRQMSRATNTPASGESLVRQESDRSTDGVVKSPLFESRSNSARLGAISNLSELVSSLHKRGLNNGTIEGVLLALLQQRHDVDKLRADSAPTWEEGSKAAAKQLAQAEALVAGALSDLLRDLPADGTTRGELDAAMDLRINRVMYGEVGAAEIERARHAQQELYVKLGFGQFGLRPQVDLDKYDAKVIQPFLAELNAALGEENAARFQRYSGYFGKDSSVAAVQRRLQRAELRVSEEEFLALEKVEESMAPELAAASAGSGRDELLLKVFDQYRTILGDESVFKMIGSGTTNDFPGGLLALWGREAIGRLSLSPSVGADLMMGVAKWAVHQHGSRELERTGADAKASKLAVSQEARRLLSDIDSRISVDHRAAFAESRLAKMLKRSLEE